jgi:hypothetical protein
MVIHFSWHDDCFICGQLAMMPGKIRRKNKGDFIMDKKEALYQIVMEIERVENLDSFDGRAELLKSLNRFYDLIDLYKPQPDYYELLVKEAKFLLDDLQRRLDGEKPKV